MSWRREITEFNELKGFSGYYPLTTMKEYINYGLENQNEILREIVNSGNDAYELQVATESICGTIEEGLSLLYDENKQLTSEIIQGIENVNYTLTHGFSSISEGLNRLTKEVKVLQDITLIGFSMLNQQIQVTNLLLDAILHSNYIPEILKEYKYYIEKGIQYLKNVKENSIYYDDAITNFSKALEKVEDDYFPAYYLGIIYSNSKKHYNKIKAQDYFLKALKYSKHKLISEDVQFGIKSSKINLRLPSQFIFNETLINLAHFSYLLYKNQKKAIQYCKEAIENSPNNIYYLLSLAKYYSIDNKQRETLKTLSKVINLNPQSTIRILTDKILISNSYVRNFLINIENNTYILAKKEIEKIELEITKSSKYLTEFQDLKRLINNRKYLDNLNALEIMGFQIQI